MPWSAARRAAYERERRVQQRMKPDGELRFCPECGDLKSTAETLRVHRWLAHQIEEQPAVNGPAAIRIL